jgi:D-3-phosphoglycerate dehydrogenase / 2-oxoglutarate reductase
MIGPTGEYVKLLLTHTPEMRHNYYGDAAVAELKALTDVTLHDGAEALAGPRLIEAARDVDMILTDRMTAGPAEIFAALPRLKAFLRCAVDIRTIDVAAASTAGVLVTRAKPGFVDAVVELTVGFLVDLARGVSRSAAQYHVGVAPDIRMGRQLSGSTLGIIGYGVIGRRLADVALALGMRVVVADPYVTDIPPPLQHMPLMDVLGAADHVVCLAVATVETENLIDARAFAAMKRDAVFLNLSRGNLVDEAALTAALVEGRIAGAAMDVGRAPDQMPTPALAALPNVIATPHIGGLTQQAIEAQAFDTVSQVRALVNGGIPHGAVNAEHWTRRLERA